MAISAAEVKKLRDMTGAGMLDCKKALEETDGDYEKAVDVLRAKGAAKAAKRADKEASEGAVGSYIHMGGRIGVLVEINCETDFVARTDDFQQLVKDVAMHIAASRPIAVTPDQVPDSIIERERAIYLEQVKNEGKPENIRDRIVEGKLKKFFQESTLLEQPFVKDMDKTVGELLTEMSGKTGEKLEIRRFARFELGE